MQFRSCPPDSPHLHGALIIAERLSRPDIATQCAALAASLTPLSMPKPVLMAAGCRPVPMVPMQVAPPSEVEASKPPLSWADIVFEKDGVPMADSRKVAEVFGKEHRNVLRAVDKLLPDLGEWGPLNFEQGVFYTPVTGDQGYRHFVMTRDGFSLLAMGFTGKRALEFKLGFIQAFNAMEDELRSQHIKKLSGHITDLSLERDKAVLERKGIADRFSGLQAKLRVTEETLERSKGELAVLNEAPKPTVPELLRQLAARSTPHLYGNKFPSPSD